MFCPAIEDNNTAVINLVQLGSMLSELSIKTSTSLRIEDTAEFGKGTEIYGV